MSLLIQEEQSADTSKTCLCGVVPRSAVNDCWQMGYMTGPDALGTRRASKPGFRFEIT